MALEKILIGFAAFNMLAGQLQLANAQPLQTTHQARIKAQSILDMALQNPDLTEKEKTLYKNTNTILNGSLKQEGRVFYCRPCTTKVNGEDVYYTIKADYSCGPRGGNGMLNLWFYLNEERGWYNEKGIGNLRWFLLTEKKPKMSKKVYEVNVNSHTGTVNYTDVDQRLMELSYVFNKSQDMFYQIAKKIKIDKKDIEKIFYWRNVANDLSKYQDKQRAVQFGNLEKLNHIYVTELNYEGCGKLDLKSDWGRTLGAGGGTLRAPKLVKIEISIGKLGIVGFNAQGDIFDFSEGNAVIVKRTGKFSVTDTLKVREAAKAAGVDVEKEELNDAESDTASD
jgi:hypothetical protein